MLYFMVPVIPFGFCYNPEPWRRQNTILSLNKPPASPHFVLHRSKCKWYSTPTPKAGRVRGGHAPEHRSDIVGGQDANFAGSQGQAAQPALVEAAVHPYHLPLPELQLLRPSGLVGVQHCTPAWCNRRSSSAYCLPTRASAVIAAYGFKQQLVETGLWNIGAAVISVGYSKACYKR